MLGGDALRERLSAEAERLGFARLGVARAERLGAEGERLTAWLGAGKHGDMDWMARTAAVRIDPRDPRMLAGAASVLVVAFPYARAPEAVGPAPGRVARYARGRDYHNVLKKRLERLATLLRAEGHAARSAVDSVPVFERAWAQRAGIGFVGKNCCLIVPGLGSHVFLGAIVTSATLPADEPMKERCGACTLCLEACPTRAFDGPRELDARRCISYLTIEHEGPVEPALREGVGEWFFGCDACQDVCPYNRTAPAEASLTEPFAPSAAWRDLDAAALLRMTEDEFARAFAGSPVRRAGREGAARNAAIVLGNAGTRVHLPVLAAAEAGDASPTVREAAAWARARILSRGE